MTASGTGLGYGEGDESYGYDSCGYLKAQSAGRHRISEETDQYAGGHRLKQAGNTQYDYDAAGRMVSRTRHRDGYRPETERFRWDSRDQLTGYCSAQGELWEYRHDASGRRTEKRCDRKKIRFTYLWDGDSIAEIREYRDDKLYSVRHLVFNGFELISQQFSRIRQAHPSVAPQWVTRTNYAVSDLTGRPLMLFNSEGKTVWRPGQTSLWGLALSLPADTGYPDPRGELDAEADPGLLYAGQWQDAESGLCYNRFRYYEPETGMYLVSDPLGLQGGEQTYRYVHNPNESIDPLGLAPCPWQIIDRFRSLKAGLSRLGEHIPHQGDGFGTVAYIEINGRKIFGVNSSVLSDKAKDLGRYWVDRLKLGRGVSQVAYHAEAHSLMRAFEKFRGKLPNEITMYVDRYTCPNCQKYLPLLMKEMGIDKLIIYSKNGKVVLLPK